MAKKKRKSNAGRKPVDPQLKRVVSRSVVFTHSEYAMIEQAAQETGELTGRWMRDRLLEAARKTSL